MLRLGSGPGLGMHSAKAWIRLGLGIHSAKAWIRARARDA